MGIRRRLKTRLKSLLGRPEPARSESAAPPPPARPAAPKAAVAPKAAKPARPVAPKPAKPAAPKPSASATPKAPPKVPGKPQPLPEPRQPTAEEEALKQKRIARAIARARKGCLTYLRDHEGSCGLGELHDHSERKYFIAHRSFSNLMEDLTGDGVVDYDDMTGEVTLTEAGRQELAG